MTDLEIIQQVISETWLTCMNVKNSTADADEAKLRLDEIAATAVRKLRSAK